MLPLSSPPAAEPRPAAAPEELRYWAFISYSHRDRSWGDWLHRALETYRVPKQLVGTETGAGRVPARVFPVFRDREEFSGGADLSRKVNEALRHSRNLIVICSPHAARSRWVNEELKLFRALGREDRIFALIVGGEPNASDDPTSSLEECFPEALRYRTGPDGQRTAERIDPIAADARQGRDGKKSALLKLLAGVLEVDYDKLKQRDQERQLRTRTRWAAALLMSTALFAVLALYANGQRNQATAAAEAETKARKIAESRQLAAQALSHMRTRPDLALLLAAEATRPASTVEARSSLVTLLQSQPGLVTFLHGHEGPVTRLAFSPDGKTLASGGEDRTVRLWSAEGRSLLDRPLYTHKRRSSNGSDKVRTLTFSPDGQMIASGSLGGTLRLGDVRTGSPVGEESEFGGTLTTVEFSPDGKRLAIGAISLGLVELETGQEVRRFFSPASLNREDTFPDAAAFSPDGRLLAVHSDEGLMVFEVGSGKPIGEALAERFPLSGELAFSPDGKFLAAGDVGGGVRLWEVETGKLVGSPLAGDDRVLALWFSQDGKHLAWIRADGSLREWDIANWRLHRRPVLLGPLASAAFSRDGKRLALGATDGSIRLWDTRPERHPLGESLFAGPVEALAFSPDGKLLATGGETLTLWDIAARRKIEDLRDWQVRGVAFGSDGRTLIAAGERGVHLWDLATRKDVAIPIDGASQYLGSVALIRGGRVLAVGAKGMTLWDLVAGRQIGRPLPETVSIYAMAASPDGTLLASGGDDKSVRLWNPATGAPVGKPAVQAGSVWSLAFSPDGRTLASGDDSGNLRLWRVPALEPLGGPLPGPRERVSALGFSPDGTMLAAAGFGRTLVVYDVASRQPLADPLFELSEYEDMTSVAFSPDGRLLAAADREGALFFLDGGLEEWKARACRLANRDLTPSERSRFLSDESSGSACAGAGR